MPESVATSPRPELPALVAPWLGLPQKHGWREHSSQALPRAGLFLSPVVACVSINLLLCTILPALP